MAQGKDGHNHLRISGQIIGDHGKKFRTLTTSLAAATVFIASLGGSINAATEIGKIVRHKRMTTIVMCQDYCASTCGLIRLADERRLLAPKARVGLLTTYAHRNGIRLTLAAGNAVVDRYIAFLNPPVHAFTVATAGGPEEVNWLDVINNRSSGIELELLESEIDAAWAVRSGVENRSGMMKVPINRTLADRQVF